MKKIILCCSLLSCYLIFHLSAMNIGIGADMGLSLSKAKLDIYGEYSTTNLSFNPFLVLRITDFLEITPFLAIIYYNSSDPKSLDSLTVDDYTMLAFGGGFGLYLHFAKNEVFDLAIGPRLGITSYTAPTGHSAPTYPYDYTDVITEIDLPILLDMKIGGDNVILRLAANIFSFSLENYSMSGYTNDYTNINFFLPVTLRLGIYFMF